MDTQHSGKKEGNIYLHCTEPQAADGAPYDSVPQGAEPGHLQL